MRQTAVRQDIVRALPDWDEPRIDITPDNFGANFARLNSHVGNGQIFNWLADGAWDATKATDDLDLIQDIGYKVVRVFMQIESVMTLSGNTWSWDTASRANLNTFMSMCQSRGFEIISVMSLGNHDGSYSSLDGKFRWGQLATQGGIDGYIAAQELFIEELEPYGIVTMYEIINEPYGDLTWLPQSIIGTTTKSSMHSFLKQCYDAAKLLTNAYVGFSEIEEYQQTMYQTFSDNTYRQTYVDDCTDVYSMHIYRSSPDQVFDFRSLTGKPKWVSELGSLNYSDPDASGHPIPGHFELYNEDKNFQAVISITAKLQAMGFEIVIPWSIGDNIGMIIHNADGTHTIKKLLKFSNGRLNND